MRADQISQQLYGAIDYTEEIIRRNPHIQTTPIIPAGTVIELPPKRKKEPKGVHLW